MARGQELGFSPECFRNILMEHLRGGMETDVCARRHPNDYLENVPLHSERKDVVSRAVTGAVRGLPGSPGRERGRGGESRGRRLFWSPPP